MKTAIVKSKDLGNCWLPARFVSGARCSRVMQCNYPEKGTCKAVEAEIAYLEEQKRTSTATLEKRINALKESQQAGIERLDENIDALKKSQG